MDLRGGGVRGPPQLRCPRAAIPRPPRLCVGEITCAHHAQAVVLRHGIRRAPPSRDAGVVEPRLAVPPLKNVGG